MTKYTPNEAEMAGLISRFSYHQPIGDQVERYATIRAMCRELAIELSLLCPPSRELSLALTRLQEANLLANAAIAIHEAPSAHLYDSLNQGSDNHGN